MKLLAESFCGGGGGGGGGGEGEKISTFPKQKVL